MFQPGAMVYTQGFGSRPEDVEVPHIESRAPNAQDILYPIGKRWIDRTNDAYYVLSSLSSVGGSLSANWLTVAVDSGNVASVSGTANQISASPTTGDVVLSLPAAITAPGSLTTTTSLAATTTVTAGTGISSTTGNIVATAGQVNSGTSMTAGTSITATLGDITATNGNFVRGTAGNKDVYSSVATDETAGANSAGSVTLAGGTATIATSALTASSLIRIYRQDIGSTSTAALGHLTIGTKTAGVSFVINSVQAADATALQASDVSVVFWEIVN